MLKNDKSVQFSITVPKAMNNQIVRTAKKLGLSKGSFIRMAIKECLRENATRKQTIEIQ